ERHGPSGQFYNWYDHTDGSKLTVWPPTGEPRTPILSSVDNGWLAVGLRVVADRVPDVSRRARALYASMDFGFYYRPADNRILFHYVPDTGVAACCYVTIVSESRIASYIGIAKGEIPPRVHFGSFRSWPDTCEASWTETEPTGFTRSYYGVPVYDGSLPYNGTLVTPGWGGSMFEALMPALFLPEEKWGPGSWGANHRLTVAAQIHHGMTEAGYGYWGFSPSEVPEGGYRTYGVDGIGSDAGGYPSNNDGTTVDAGWLSCGRAPVDPPPPSAYTNGVVTPHAAFLGLRFARGEAVSNLARLERDFPDMYGPLGFRDSVNVDTGQVASTYLSLDQGMIMAALGNELEHDMLRSAFAKRDMERALRPVMGVEEFSASPRPCTVVGTPGRDVLRGGPRDDVICGLGGLDEISAGRGDDVLFGDEGDDRLDGGDGDDTLYGGEGGDRLVAGSGVDVVSGGPGVDTFRGSGRDHFEPGD
ncbi:MAG TPA: glucoamylase family protein, partial [Actinomycetospora sp.]|nr:glucoamylase family protein [Actinomycetospora sp.]